MQKLFTAGFVVFALGCLAACAAPKVDLTQKPAAQYTEPKNARTQLNEIASRYEHQFFEHHPESAMFWGRADAALDRFMDHSLKGLQQWYKIQDQTLAELNQLKISELKGGREYQTFQLLKENLENSKAARICKMELWDMNPLWGWHNVLGNVAEMQPGGTPEKRAQALKRWHTVSQVVDEELNKLKLGLKTGYTAPKPAVQRVLKQLTLILGSKLEDSPFFVFAKKDGDAEFKKQMGEIITQEVQPALQRFATYLEKDYLPRARGQVGVSALPNGAKCYQTMVKRETTLGMPAQTIFDIGQKNMRQLEKEVAVIGQKEFGVQAMSEVFRQGKSKTRGVFKNEKELLEYNEAALARVLGKVPAFFAHTPHAKGTLRPYPLHRAKTGAPGEYRPPTEDGKEPGIFFINTYEAQNKSGLDQESTLFHELIPGHHFQIALTLEDHTAHTLDKYLWNSGFGEGWALYAERLADEMGVYSDDVSRLGMLSNEAFRSARLVLDTGLHVKNWTRARAVTYLKEHTALEDNIIEGEVDRYIMAPGQATSYLLGKREIMELREAARKKLGAKFDVRAYHEQVLKNGTVTLPMLRKQIEKWQTEVLAAPAGGSNGSI